MCNETEEISIVITVLIHMVQLVIFLVFPVLVRVARVQELSGRDNSMEDKWPKDKVTSSIRRPSKSQIQTNREKSIHQNELGVLGVLFFKIGSTGVDALIRPRRV